MWKKCLVIWVNACGFLAKTIEKLEDFRIEVFFFYYLQYIKKDPMDKRVSIKEELDRFMKEIYPNFKFKTDCCGYIQRCDYVYVYTILLHYSFVDIDFFPTVFKEVPSDVCELMRQFFICSGKLHQFTRQRLYTLLTDLNLMEPLGPQTMNASKRKMKYKNASADSDVNFNDFARLIASMNLNFYGMQIIHKDPRAELEKNHVANQNAAEVNGVGFEEVARENDVNNGEVAREYDVNNGEVADENNVNNEEVAAEIRNDNSFQIMQHETLIQTFSNFIPSQVRAKIEAGEITIVNKSPNEEVEQNFNQDNTCNQNFTFDKAKTANVVQYPDVSDVSYRNSSTKDESLKATSSTESQMNLQCDIFMSELAKITTYDELINNRIINMFLSDEYTASKDLRNPLSASDECLNNGHLSSKEVGNLTEASTSNSAQNHTCSRNLTLRKSKKCANIAESATQTPEWSYRNASKHNSTNEEKLKDSSKKKIKKSNKKEFLKQLAKVSANDNFLRNEIINMLFSDEYNLGDSSNNTCERFNSEHNSSKGIKQNVAPKVTRNDSSTLVEAEEIPIFVASATQTPQWSYRNASKKNSTNEETLNDSSRKNIKKFKRRDFLKELAKVSANDSLLRNEIVNMLFSDTYYLSNPWRNTNESHNIEHNSTQEGNESLSFEEAKKNPIFVASETQTPEWSNCDAPKENSTNEEIFSSFRMGVQKLNHKDFLKQLAEVSANDSLLRNEIINMLLSDEYNLCDSSSNAGDRLNSGYNSSVEIEENDEIVGLEQAKKMPHLVESATQTQTNKETLINSPIEEPENRDIRNTGFNSERFSNTQESSSTPLISNTNVFITFNFHFNQSKYQNAYSRTASNDEYAYSESDYDNDNISYQSLPDLNVDRIIFDVVQGDITENNQELTEVNSFEQIKNYMDTETAHLIKQLAIVKKKNRFLKTQIRDYLEEIQRLKQGVSADNRIVHIAIPNQPDKVDANPNNSKELVHETSQLTREENSTENEENTLISLTQEIMKRLVHEKDKTKFLTRQMQEYRVRNQELNQVCWHLLLFSMDQKCHIEYTIEAKDALINDFKKKVVHLLSDKDNLSIDLSLQNHNLSRESDDLTKQLMSKNVLIEDNFRTIEQLEKCLNETYDFMLNNGNENKQFVAKIQEMRKKYAILSKLVPPAGTTESREMLETITEED